MITDFDLGYSTSSYQFSLDSLDDYDNLLDDDYLIKSNNNNNTAIATEHNYFSNLMEFDMNESEHNKTQPGVCLHVAGGRVSLEFCSTCHTNAQNAWIEEN